MDGLTYYDVLGVVRDADEQTVRRAFRSQQRATHPDTTGVDSHVQYDLVMRAGQTLTDPAKRAAYDATLADAQAPESAPEPEPPAPDPAEDDGWGVWGEQITEEAPVVDEAPSTGLAPAETVWTYARRGAIRAAVVGGPALLAAFLLAWAGRSAPAATLLALLVAAAVLAAWAARRRVSARARRIAIVTAVAVVTCVWWRQGAPDGVLTALSLGACSLVPIAPFVSHYYLEEVAP